MTQKLKAIYRDGAFVPQGTCHLPNNTEVELTIRQDQNFNLDIIDPEARKQIFNALLRRMRQNQSTFSNNFRKNVHLLMIDARNFLNLDEIKKLVFYD